MNTPNDTILTADLTAANCIKAYSDAVADMLRYHPGSPEFYVYLGVLKAVHDALTFAIQYPKQEEENPSDTNPDVQRGEDQGGSCSGLEGVGEELSQPAV